jgi:hypothetical protein
VYKLCYGALGLEGGVKVVFETIHMKLTKRQIRYKKIEYKCLVKVRINIQTFVSMFDHLQCQFLYGLLNCLMLMV